MSFKRKNYIVDSDDEEKPQLRLASLEEKQKTMQLMAQEALKQRKTDFDGRELREKTRMKYIERDPSEVVAKRTRSQRRKGNDGEDTNDGDDFDELDFTIPFFFNLLTEEEVVQKCMENQFITYYLIYLNDDIIQLLEDKFNDAEWTDLAKLQKISAVVFVFWQNRNLVTADEATVMLDKKMFDAWRKKDLIGECEEYDSDEVYEVDSDDEFNYFA